MYNKANRDEPYQRQLMAFVRNEYSFFPITIAPAKRGYYGETWRLATADRVFFLKLNYATTHAAIYQNSFPVMDHLCQHGIDFISKIVKTTDGRLFTTFDNAVLGVFEWIDGENLQNQTTKIQEYQMLAKIYTIPSNGIIIPKTEFSTASAKLFYQQWEMLQSNFVDETDRKLTELFKQNKAKITHRAQRLRHFAARCQPDTSHFYITHGDAGGNIIQDGDRFYLVDWDDPMLAPPERDAWFCLHWDWATDAFHQALCQNAIDYQLRPERLAYYCYHMFFWYLTTQLEAYFAIGNAGGNHYQEIADYLTCWLEDNLAYADRI